MLDNYATGNTIKRLRESKHMTQAELAEKIDVSPKTVSKWETVKGLPDISLLEPLYVCPICGNIIHTMGEAVISCCGVTLPPLEAEEVDDAHKIIVENVEDEQFITVPHKMTKNTIFHFLRM